MYTSQGGDNLSDREGRILSERSAAGREAGQKQARQEEGREKIGNVTVEFGTGQAC